MSTGLKGQTVLVIGGSAGIGLETARAARAEGAEIILTARNGERLERAAADVGAFKHEAFDASDFGRLETFFDGLAGPVDQVMVTAGGPSTLPIGRVVGPEDVAALAVHLMTNTAITGATFDIDGGQQLIS